MAVSLDLDTYDQRRAGMLTFLEAACGAAPFSAWLKDAESIAARREKLEGYLNVLYILLEDVLLTTHHPERVRNRDIAGQLQRIAEAASFEWLNSAVKKVDELYELLRRNIQKSVALDALLLSLRTAQ